MSILRISSPRSTPDRFINRAPKGGMVSGVNGRFYKGGTFMPMAINAVTPAPGPGPTRTTVFGFVYTIEPARIHPEVGSVAFRMTKVATNNTYHVHRDIHGEVRCDCPDFEFKRSGTGVACKHGARLVELGMLLAATPRAAEAPRAVGSAPVVATPARPRWYGPTPEEIEEANAMFREPACC